LYLVKKKLFVCKKISKNNIYIYYNYCLLMSDNNNNDNNFDIVNKEYFDNLPEHIAIKTAVWGPPTWFFLHSMTLAYPKKIDDNNSEHVKKRKSMYIFLSNLGNILPCNICGDSYSQYIMDPNFAIWPHLKSRAKLFHLIHEVHNRVNEKLGVPLCDRPSFRKVVKYYNQFKANNNKPCSATTEQERTDSLLAGCSDSDIMNKKFKKYKCFVNVIDEVNNEKVHLLDKDKIKEDENNEEEQKKENFGKSNIKLCKNNNILVFLIIILLFVIFYLIFNLNKK
jgi:hypothetical protein